MARKNSPNVRIDPDFEREMRNIALERVNKGLSKNDRKEMNVREMTMLLRRTDGYKQSIEELRTKPKRRDLV